MRVSRWLPTSPFLYSIYSVVDEGIGSQLLSLINRRSLHTKVTSIMRVIIRLPQWQYNPSPRITSSRTSNLDFSLSLNTAQIVGSTPNPAATVKVPRT